MVYITYSLFTLQCYGTLKHGKPKGGPDYSEKVIPEFLKLIKPNLKKQFVLK